MSASANWRTMLIGKLSMRPWRLLYVFRKLNDRFPCSQGLRVTELDDDAQWNVTGKLHGFTPIQIENQSAIKMLCPTPGTSIRLL